MSVTYVRFERFRQVVDKALEECAKTLSLEKLVSCYPMYQTQEGRQILEVARQQTVSFFKRVCLEEFESIYRENQLQEKLDSLELLISRAKDRAASDAEPLFVKDLTPEQVIDSKLLPVKLEMKASLQGLLQTLKDEVTRLHEQLEQSTREIRDTVESINTLAVPFEELQVDVTELDDAKVERLFNFVVDRDLESL